MDTTTFDNLTRAVALDVRSRRSLVKRAAGAALAAALGRIGLEESEAAACRKVGDECRRAGQCCSGVCKGPDGKRTCRAHGVGTCTARRDVCKTGDGVVSGCGGDRCFCIGTTAGSVFCAGNFTECAACQRDSQCEELGFPPGSACIRLGRGACTTACAEVGDTACVIPCGAEIPPRSGAQASRVLAPV